MQVLGRLDIFVWVRQERLKRANTQWSIHLNEVLILMTYLPDKALCARLNALARALKLSDDEEWHDLSKRPIEAYNNVSDEVRIFDSIADAARYYNTSTTIIHKRISKEARKPRTLPHIIFSYWED